MKIAPTWIFYSDNHRQFNFDPKQGKQDVNNNLISCVALDRATNSASLDNMVMLICMQLFQLMGTSIKKKQNSVTLTLVSVSPT